MLPYLGHYRLHETFMWEKWAGIGLGEFPEQMGPELGYSFTE